MGSPDSGSGDALQDSLPPDGRALVFVSDPSAEAGELASALRARGYTVIDVPLQLLVGRVAVQRPSLIVCDVDAEGAIETVGRLRDVPGGSVVEIIFLGEAGRTLEDNADAVFHEGSAFFVRPIDLYAGLRKIEALIGPPSSPNSVRSALSVPPSQRASSRPPQPRDQGAVEIRDSDSTPSPASERAPSSAPAGPPTSSPSSKPPRARLSSQPAPVARASYRPRGDFESARPSAAESVPVPSSSAESAEPGPPSLPPAPSLDGEAMAARGSLHATMSADLEALLASAETRLGTASSQPPSSDGERSPEQEVDAVLPPDVLAALDEPLDDEDVGFEEDDDERRGTPGRSSMGSDPGTGVKTGVGPTGTGHGTGSGHVTNAGHLTAARALGGGDPSSHGSASGATGHGTGAGHTNVLGREPAGSPDTSAHAQFSAVPGVTGDGALAPRVNAPTVVPGSATQGAPATFRDAEAAAFDAVTNPGRPRSSPPEDGARGMEEMAHVPPPVSEAPRTTAAPSPFASVASPKGLPEIPSTLRRGDAVTAIARAVRARLTGGVAFETAEGVRRAVLRDGDLVTAASGVEGESLVSFLVARGDLAADVEQSLGRRIASFGRHAGAALIAHGHLRQDALWGVLRAHAEWILGRAMSIESGSAGLERSVPGRLEDEPAVFGGATGAEVFVELVRRVVPPDEAVRRLGGARVRLAAGPGTTLLAECALRPDEASLVDEALASSIGAGTTTTTVPDAPSVLYALWELGVLARATLDTPGVADDAPPGPGDDAIDDEALRARVKRRLSLVEDGDYFSILGVRRDATPYDIRRAYVELRRDHEPGRVLTARTADLLESVETILEVLDEAYDILRDGVRRERYRRAIEASP